MRLRLNNALNTAKIRMFCMEARELCSPEAFSVIHHNKKKLLAKSNCRKKEGKMLKRTEKSSLLNSKVEI